MENVTVGYILSGLLLGVAFGFVLQRGRYCMNTAFRDVIFVNDLTLFRGYILALIISIVGSNILQDMGYITMWPQPFAPFANILGGYIFGLGMVLAGGCGSGIWYRVGEGQFASVVAVIGFALGITSTSNGILNPLYTLLRSYNIQIAGSSTTTLWQIFGDGMTAKWVVIVVLTILAALFILKGKPFSFGKQKGFYWSVSGLLIGIMAIIFFWASEFWGSGFARGLNFTTPTGELLLTLVTGNAQSAFAKMQNLGPFKITWASLNIIGVPVGAYISARILKEFAWKVPPANELLTVFGGSFMMGFGAKLGGGCNIGQALTGVSTLAIGSIIASIFIILGNWTIVYFKFIKPMRD
ncbi:MAG: YeeE/YedE family protein [Thermodesulfovibrionia bacterium]|nr:YeeE/YedE family protein [Thermodesulfovibrionia bacterium]